MNSCISNCFWCSGACMSLLLWAEVGKSGLTGEYALQTASFCISMKSTWNKSINWEHIFQLHFTAFERINHMCSGNVSSDHKLRCGLGGRWSNICSFSMLYLSTHFSLPSTWWQSLSLLPRFSVFLPFPWGSKLVRMGYNPGFITTDAGLAPSKISLTLWSYWPSCSLGVLPCCLGAQGPSAALLASKPIPSQGPDPATAPLPGLLFPQQVLSILFTFFPGLACGRAQGPFSLSFCATVGWWTGS